MEDRDPYHDEDAVPRREKAASSINCRDFDSTKNDFDRWVKKFEKAVKLATNVRDDAGLAYLYKEWLPLKLDEVASSHLEQIDVDGETWVNIKTKMCDFLVDPQLRLRWRARQYTITWDGKESMHTLASRVRHAVNIYDQHLPQDIREMEYYTRFRMAFKKTLMRVIDMNCPEGAQTIDNAKDAVMRYLLASAGDDPPASGDVYKSVAFADGKLHPDRATSLETSLASIATQMENVAISVRTLDDRHKGFESRLRSLEDRSDRGGRRDSSYDRGYRRDDSREDRRSRDRGRGYSRRSPPPRRDYDNRKDRRKDRYRDRYDSRDRSRDRYDSRDRSRGRYDSRDRSRGRDDSRDRSSRSNRDNSGDRQSSRGGGNRRGDQSGDRGDRQGSAQKDRNDDYRAIDTADEVSSDESGDDAKATRTKSTDDDSGSSCNCRKGN